jgi:hypothetical protein
MPTRRLLEVSTSVSWNLIIRIGGICLLHECIDVKILPVKLNEILFEEHLSDLKLRRR